MIIGCLIWEEEGDRLKRLKKQCQWLAQDLPEGNSETAKLGQSSFMTPHIYEQNDKKHYLLLTKKH